MSDTDLKKTIALTHSLIDHIRFLIPKANICNALFGDILALISFFQGEIRSNNNNKYSNEEVEAFQPLLVTFEKLILLLQLVQQGVWPNISLSLNIKHVFEDIEQIRNTLIDQIQKIKIFNNIIEQLPTEEKIKATALKDLNQIFFLFNQADIDIYLNQQNQQNLQKQRARLLNIYDKYKLNTPQFNLVITHGYNPVQSSKDWKFDLSQIPEGQEPHTLIDDKNTSLALIKTNNSTSPIFKLTVHEDITNKEDRKLIKKKILLLTGLKNIQILGFLGASIDGEIACYFSNFGKDSQSIFIYEKCLHKIIDGSKNLASKVAFYAAKGMRFLHSRGIIHGDLSPKSFLFNSSSNDLRIWNFIFSRGNNINENRAPPEFFEKGIYTLESDVFQFGSLLYQIGVKEYPRSVHISQPDLKDRAGKECFSPELKQLIKDCWNTDPSQRPTFDEIMQRFMTGKIFYGVEKIDKLEEFYNIQRSKKFDSLRTKDGMAKFEQLLSQNDEPGDKDHYNIRNCLQLTKFLQRIFIDFDKGDKKRIITQLGHLESFGFFEYVIPFFETKEGKAQEKFIENYLKIFTVNAPENILNLKDLSQKFLEKGGSKIIVDFLKKDEKDRELATKIYESVEPYVTDESEESLTQLVPAFIEAHKIDYVQNIILSRTTPAVACKLISQNMKEISKNAVNLVEFYVENRPESKDIAEILAKEVIKSGNYELLTKLMKSTFFLNSIKSEDCKEVIETIASDTSDENQKRCAVLLSLGLDKDFFEVLSKFNVVVDKVVHMSDQELASRFIARLTYFKTSSEYLLSGLEKETNNEYEPIKDMNEPFYLISLSRIARMNTNRFISLPFLKDNIIRNIKNHQEVEGTLRLAGVLSRESSFWTDLKVAQSLIQLSQSNTTNKIETELLLSVISNIVSIKEVKALFSEPSSINSILFIIENNGAYSGIAMRILARLNIPSYSSETRHQFERIVSCIKSQLSEGNGFGVEGSAQVIINIIENEENTIEDIINIDEIYKHVIERSKKERNAQIFIKLMECINMFERGPQSELIPLFSNIIMASRGQLPAKFYTLKAQLT